MEGVGNCTLTTCDTTQYSMDRVTHNIIDTAFSCIIVNVIAILGTFGNIINVIVLSRHGFRDSTNILLLSMSAVDTLFLVTSIPKRFVCVLSKYDFRGSLVLNAYVTAYLWMPNRYCGLISSGLVTFISLERFVAVHFPLTVSTLITPVRTLAAILLLFVFWAMLSGPFFGLYNIAWFHDARSNLELPQIFLAHFVQKDPESLNILNLSLAVIRGPVSVVVIVISSVAISRRLHGATKKMTGGSCIFRNSRDVRVIKMLLVVTSVYAVIGIPLLAPYIAYYIYPESCINRDGTLTATSILLEIINDFLYVINASVNFVIYVTMSKKFYNTYLDVFSSFMLGHRRTKCKCSFFCSQ